MGVVVEITIDDDDAERARVAARAAQEELDRLDQLLSDWKQTSELSQINASRDLRVGASSELRAVLSRALEVARATDGRFDPTIGPFVALWRQTRRAGGFPPADAKERALREARERVGFEKVSIDGTAVVRTHADVAIDFGGIGKGFGAVRALEALRARGCPRALVAVAGDLAAGDAPRGTRGWRIEIDAEQGEDEWIECANEAVSTSGASAQWVEIDGVRYAHIVDPRTGLGATELAQVTVVGPLDCAGRCSVDPVEVRWIPRAHRTRRRGPLAQVRVPAKPPSFSRLSASRLSDVWKPSVAHGAKPRAAALLHQRVQSTGP